MDSVPSVRNINLPFSVDHTAPSSSTLGTHSLYYKQLSNSPLQLTSEWGENNPPAASARDLLRNAAGSPSMIKMAPAPSRLLEETPTPSRRSEKANIDDPAYTSGKMGSATAANAHAPSAPSHAAKNGSKSTSPGLNGAHGAYKHVSAVDVLWAMLNDLTGKDKMAKFAQYSLRLILYHARKTQSYLSDDSVNIKSISATYASNEKVLDLLVSFVKNPRGFAKILVILTCSMFTSRLSGFVPALGLYRQLLRFGKSPFRFNMLFEKIRKHMYRDPKGHAWKISDKFFSKSTLGDCISLYYNFNDDIGLLYKVKLLHNKSLKSFASDHESYAWYCDSWFALYNAYANLQRLSQQEFDTKISIQVKKRSRTISRQVLGGNSLQVNTSSSDDDAKDIQALKDIQFKITNTKLDIYKLISDIIFNSYTVFNAKLHFDTVQIWMGISASFLSSVKLFREKKKSLTAYNR